jgi:hypothetical protein
MQAQKVNGGTVLLFPNISARRGWVFNATLRPFNPRETAAVSMVQEAWWGPAWA